MHDHHLESQGPKAFAQIPNALIDAWANGRISDPCFKLIVLCLRHSDNFHIKYNYLHRFCKMHEKTIRKAQTEAIGRNILTITKIRQNRSFVNVYRVNSFNEWNLGSIDTLTAEVVIFTNSPQSDSEVRELKNTNPKNTNPKKKNLNPTTTTAIDPITLTHSESLTHKDKESKMDPNDEFGFLEKTTTAICSKLRDEHNTVSDAKLMRHYLNLAQQNTKREMAFYDSHIEEIVLYCVAQKNPTRDPSVTVFNWLKYYREKEPPKQRGKSTNGKLAVVPYIEPTQEEIDSW